MSIKRKHTIRYHLTPVRMAVINKSTNRNYWQGCREKGTLVHCWWECRPVQPLWKIVWRYLKKIKLDLSFDPANPFLGMYLKKPKTLSQKIICTPMFISALFSMAKIWKQHKYPSVDDWFKKKTKQWYIYMME